MLLSFLPTIAKRLGVKVPGGTATTGVTVLLFAGALHSGVMSQRLAAQSLPDHQAFTAVLADVVQQPLIDYQKLKDNRVGLDAYLRSLAAVDPALLDGASEDRVLAFWINTYNACMLRLVVDHYPIQKAGGILARIKNVVADRPANSVWQISDVFSRKHCAIAGAERSQDEIEHELIRPMGDPRIHFAVNCAALSCPPLWPEAYDGGNLDAQLDRAVANLLGNTQHMAVEGESVRLNKVLDWYNEDFGGHGGLKTFMVPYVAGDVAAVLSDPRTKLDFFDYDWTLNDIRR